MTVAWLDDVWRGALAPAPQLTVSEWADAHRMLPDTAAEPGRWRTDRVPYLAGIMDVLSTASPWERVVLMKGAQVGATEAGLNWLGYLIHHAPGLALLVMPSLDMARRNTRTRIDPMIEATPALRDLVAPARSREATNTTFAKSFPGGMLVMTGANSAAALRSTPARYIFLDEVDGFPADAGGEGDPVALAIQRTVTFAGRRKIYLASTPTVAGVSRIEKAFLEGDQRRFEVPCPHCGTFAAISWARIRWPDGRRREAHLICEDCKGTIPESDKLTLIEAGLWRATAPGDGRTASFHLSALYSPFETWAEIALEHQAARGDPPRLQAWQNLKLGEPYEDTAAQPVEPQGLASRAESWADQVPAGVGVIVAGIDVQDDRLELEIVGFGLGEESWSLDYQVIPGDPNTSTLWEELDTSLRSRWKHACGVDLGIRAACIDTGGHHTLAVYRFIADKGSRAIWAIKGAARPGMPPWPRNPSRVNKGRTPLYLIGTDALKDAFLARLRLEDPGAGFCHFPIGRGLDYYAGLGAERPVRRYHKGVARREWVKVGGARNEPLDCRVYAMAALEGLKASGLRIDREIAILTTRGERGSASPRPRVIKSRYLEGR